MVKKLIGTLVLAAAAWTAAPGDAGAALFQWSWQPGDAGSYENDGGRINWIQSSFDTSTNRLTWYANFGTVPGGGNSWQQTDGFTLALNNGPNPKGHEGELALLYFDASRSSGPRLSVYGYNGRNDHSSYYDGTKNNTINGPDRILTSMDASAGSWIQDLTATGANNQSGGRTLGFSIDVTDILQHNPLYTQGDTEWTGAQYAENIGVWFHTFTELDTRYRSDGYLKRWNYCRQGWLDLSYGTTDVTDPVPEPASLLLLGSGLGLAGLLARRRRGQR